MQIQVNANPKYSTFSQILHVQGIACDKHHCIRRIEVQYSFYPIYCTLSTICFLSSRCSPDIQISLGIARTTFIPWTSRNCLQQIIVYAAIYLLGDGVRSFAEVAAKQIG